MLRCLVVMLCSLISLTVSAQQRPASEDDGRALTRDWPAIGLRDPVGLGISIGTPTAAWTDVRIVQWKRVRVEVEGSFGAGIASWGMGEGHSAGVRVDVHLTDDGIDDALLLSPRLGYSEIVGERPRSGWFSLNFAPYATVGAAYSSCGLGWVHEYRSWSFETSIVPGGALAVSGIDNNNHSAKGQLSFQLFVKAAVRF